MTFVNFEMTFDSVEHWAIKNSLQSAESLRIYRFDPAFVTMRAWPKNNKR